jgi:hypothetical protein
MQSVRANRAQVGHKNILGLCIKKKKKSKKKKSLKIGHRLPVFKLFVAPEGQVLLLLPQVVLLPHTQPANLPIMKKIIAGGLGVRARTTTQWGSEWAAASNALSGNPPGPPGSPVGHWHGQPGGACVKDQVLRDVKPPT